jgi:hypothetical protein
MTVMHVDAFGLITWSLGTMAACGCSSPTAPPVDITITIQGDRGYQSYV